MKVESHLIFESESNTLPGFISAAGILLERYGIANRMQHPLGRYALVYVTAGQGSFRDGLGLSMIIHPGDLIFLFPEIGHQYGPGHNSCWDEIFVVFEGDAFDLWRGKMLLDPAKPVLHLETVDYWQTKIKEAIWFVKESGTSYALSRLTRLQQLLADIFLYDQEQNGAIDRLWLEKACQYLAADLDRKPNYQTIADMLGMSYEAFRKRFARESGMSLGKYRNWRRIEQAAGLLIREGLTLKEIALRLGFSDEFHLSKRFKQFIGVSPSQYRKYFVDGSSQTNLLI
jgi:AraC-like DNA-binding protein